MPKIEPLANKMRPSKIEEVIGQKHLLGQNKPIYRMVKNKKISSLILFGPAGVGKTTIANAIANSIDIPFRALNGVTDGKKEIDTVIKEAKANDETYLLYIDEIHRLTKTQSEPLLPAMENGTIILVGSTTESVYHSLPSGILSRSTVYELHPLKSEDIVEGLKRALTDKVNGLGEYKVDFSDELLEFISQTVGGDMRSALTALETVVISNTDLENEEVVVVTEEMITDVTSKKSLGYSGENSRYDLMSALQKSIRGSDTDAALIYLAMLIESGDLVSILRRLGVILFEDCSLSSQNGMMADVISALNTAEKVGFPEARIPLANAVIMMCLSPKSSSAYEAINKAIGIVNSQKINIPKKLRDTHYAGAKDLNNGVDYLYPHNYKIPVFGSWVKQQYLPEGLENIRVYEPVNAGREQKLAEVYEKLTEMKNK